MKSSNRLPGACAMTLRVALLTFVMMALLPAAAQETPVGYFNGAQSDAILDKTLRIHLSPPLGHLNDAERAALPYLLDAGRRLHNLYLRQKHHQSLGARDTLQALHGSDGSGLPTASLLDLFRLAKGPVITTLTNKREPFLPVVPEMPGRNVYPLDLADAELDKYLVTYPARRKDILAERNVVRRASTENIARYIGVLDRWPVLDTLHPALRDRLLSVEEAAREREFLAIPYSVEYADQLMLVYADLHAAARELADSDGDLAAYLRNRARDLLSDDYESGDASWVTGQFGNLNAQIGSYETYDDKLYGVKSFFSFSLLARDEAKSRQLAGAVSVIQEIEDELPYDAHKRVRNNIPVGVYNVIADYGQSRGSNTATILPNDAGHSRKYGRTILLRYNIMTNADIFATIWHRFAAVMDDTVHSHLTSEARFNRTLFHEIGHYLGVDQTHDGRSLDSAIGVYSDLLEEMKSDLVSLFAIPRLEDSGYYSADMSRAVRAAGVSRTLQLVEPRRNQPYQTMQLMQFNYLLENGVLGLNERNGSLTIDYKKFQSAVTLLLREVLDIQRAGEPQRAEDFVERWGYWRAEPHARIAERMRAAGGHRYILVTYEKE